MKHVVPAEALTQKLHLKYLDSLRDIALNNRHKATRAEEVLWYEILNNRKLGHKFVRQKPIGKFVADFYCSELLIIVEADGGYHLKNKYYDKERDRYFDILNIMTVRVKNEEIFNNLNDVKNKLKLIIFERESVLKSSPSSRGGGRRPEGF